MESLLVTIRDAAKRALSFAYEEIPEDIARSGIFRQFFSWPDIEFLYNFTLPELESAVRSASGSSASVFSFLRYHDYARARRSSEFIEFLSRQNDVMQPLYVYWQVSRQAVVVQQSQQPEIAANQLSVPHTAKYVASALDFACHFYHAIGVHHARFLVRLVAPASTLVTDGQGSTGEFPAYEPEHSDVLDLPNMSMDLSTLAVRAVQDLLYQCDLKNVLDETIRAYVEAELRDIEERRRALV